MFHNPTINKYNVRSLCSLVIFEVKYKTRLFRIEKTEKLKVWYTPFKIHNIEPDPTIEGTFFKPRKFTVDFKIGDNIEKAFKWAVKNNHKIVHIDKKWKKVNK